MVPLARNHYRVLRVAPDATMEEIEQSFRQLARRLHPDHNGGDGADEERMKELNVARTILTDAGARAAYDEELRRPPGSPNGPMSTAPSTTGAAPRAPGKPLVPSRPLVSWMRTREAPPRPAATSEIRRMASVGRVVWIGLAALFGLVVVVALIWLREALFGGS
jgi:curved DNA-binding protein CbpA